jgi:hypothetical protein
VSDRAQISACTRALLAGLDGRHRLRDPRGQAVVDANLNLKEEVLFGLEVVVQQALRDPSLLRDVAHGHAAVPGLREAALRGVEDAPDGLNLVVEDAVKELMRAGFQEHVGLSGAR